MPRKIKPPPGTLLKSIFKGGSFVTGTRGVGLLGSTTRGERVTVITANDGWALVVAQCGIGWVRLRGFEEDVQAPTDVG